MTDIKKQIAGRRSKIVGELFENRIDRACDYYKEKGIAIIEKTPEPFHIQKSLGEGRFMGNFEKKAQPDYKGVLENGQCIIFEAKHTDSDRINKSRVTEEQADILDDYDRMGAQCFVMVSFGLLTFYRIPWKDWKNMKQLFGRQYATKEDLKPYQLIMKNITVLILEGVEISDN